MSKLNYVNIGCGSKYHKDWINLDLVSDSDQIQECDIMQGIPLEDNSMEVVYHSQFLEHIFKEKAAFILKECHRVLQPGGIMRIVVPDLENIARSYIASLEATLDSPTEENILNHEWMIMELLDQSSRNYPGGEMGKVLLSETLKNEDFILGRTGAVGKKMRSAVSTKKSPAPQPIANGGTLTKILKLFKKETWRNRMKALILSEEEKRLLKVGQFRFGGEVHYWMYDRYSLTNLLKITGFSEVNVMMPTKSNIPNWEDYELDVKDSLAYDPTSLFIEATKSKISE